MARASVPSLVLTPRCGHEVDGPCAATPPKTGSARGWRALRAPSSSEHSAAHHLTVHANLSAALRRSGPPGETGTGT